MSANIFQDPETGDWYSGPAPGSEDDEEQLRSRGIVVDPVTREYFQVPESSIPHWRKPEPLMAPQEPDEPSIEDGVGLADYARSVMAGGAQIGQAAGWLLKQGIGAEKLGASIEELGRNAVDYWNEGLSPAAKDALSREFVRKNEAGEYEWGDANLHTVGMFGAQSLLGSAAGAGAGAGITKVLQAFANPVGRTALMRAAQAGSEQALKKLALVDKVIGAAGFATGEGIVGGASAGVNVYDRVMQMSPEDITSNDRYRQVFESTDENLPMLERHQYAAETVAREASSLAGLQAGLTTALLGAPMGAFFGSMFGKSTIGKMVQSRAARAGTGAAGEAAQEFAQGGAEAVISNKALQGAGSDVDTWDDVLNQALGGAVAGAPLGAALGLAEQPQKPRIPSLDEMAKAVPPPAEMLALPAPRGEADFTVGPNGEAIPRGATRPERLALPPPGGNADFTVTAEGETIPRGEQRTTAPDPMRQWARDARATTTEIRGAQQARAQQEGETLGTTPTRVPGANAKQWNQQTLQRLKASATEAKDAGVERKAIVDLLTRTAKGEVTPLAARRELLQMQERATAERKPKALPAPRPAAAFEATPAGETRQLTEAEARQADDRRTAAAQERVELGTAPTVVPGTGQKKWTTASKQRVKAAMEGAVTAGVPREVAQGVVTRMNKGEISPLIAARNLKQLQRAQTQQAPTPTEKPRATEPKETPSEVPRGTSVGKSTKPRLAESAEDLRSAIVKQTEQGVPTERGVLFPVVRIPGMQGNYSITGKGVDRVSDDGHTVMPATKSEATEIEQAVERDQVQVMLRTRWGGSGGNTASKDFQELHNPSANNFGKPMPGAEDIKPRADKGYKTYRYKGRYGYVTIGANNKTEALKEAERSIDGKADAANLEELKGEEFVPVGGKAKPLLSRGKAQNKQRLGLLPRDMREELFGVHATFSDPDAKQADFNLKVVPKQKLRVDNIEGLMDIPAEQLERYNDPTKLPPVVIADGRLVDGQHRIKRAQQQGVTELEAIDMTGLINTEEAGYITELPGDESAAHSDPANAAPPTSSDGQTVEDYDAAVALQKEAVAPRLRRGPTVRTAGAVREELKDFIAAIGALVNVQVWETAQEFQVGMGFALPADGAGAVKGGWFGDNTIHLVAENLAPGEALNVAVHETFGHLAIERLPGGEAAIQRVRQQIDSGAAWVKPYVDKIAPLYGNVTSDEMAREVIAHMAEEGVDNRIMAKLIRAVREFLRKMGVEFDGETEVRDLIVRSARALRRDAVQARQKLRNLTPGATDQQILDAIDEEIPPGVVEIDAYLALRAARDQAAGDTADIDAELARLEGKTPGGDNTLRLKKPLRSAGGGQTDTPAFRKWFGDSRVVDENGRPLVVWHGVKDADMRIENGEVIFTPKFDVFDTEGRTEPGAWFSLDPAVARKFGTPVPFYLKAVNPLRDESPLTARPSGHDAVYRVRGKGERIDQAWEIGVFDPSQIKLAKGNRGTFDPSSRSILFKRAAAADPDVQTILDRVMVKPPEAMTMRDRARELWHKITDTTGLQLKQGFIDSFASIEALERDANNGALRDAADSAYKAALATKNLSSVMAGVMLKGVPSFKGGTYVPEPGRRSIIDIFDPLTRHKDGNLLSQWEGYAAARRASRLIKEKNIDGSSRENLFTQAEIDTLMKLEQRYPEFARVFDEWQTFNKQVLDLAQEAGVIDPETRVLWERNDYVPFYRAAEELGGKTGPSNKGGLANQSSGIRQLKGGEAMLGNVFENMMMNTAHLIDASFKNRAMQRIVELGTGTAMEKVDLSWEAVKFSDAQMAAALRKAGIEVDSMDKAQREHWSTLFRRIAPKGPNIVSVMKDGKPEYYEVTDPLVLQSIAGLGYDNFADVFGLFRGSKKLLTNAITADPAFMLANFVRDTLSNWVISDAGTKPMIDAVKALKATLKDDPDLVQLMMSGAGGGGFYDSAPEDIRKLIADRVPANRQRAFLDSVVGPKNVWRLWRKVGAAAENANRIATFRAVIAAGGTVAEAAYQARDVLNFSMAGNFGAMRWLTQSVPFLNARVQGLYRLYRGARDNKRAFFIKGLMLSAATMALALTNADDDEYEELPEWDKDTYWHLFVGGEHFRIPKPFEVGALFSTIPERLFRTATGRDSSGLLVDRIAQMALDTFAFNPVPQLVKPIIEQYANRSMFTGSPIVGMAEQNLQPEAQFTPWTSETMRELAKLMPDFAPAWLRSPRRLEAALRAYTGAIGMYILGAADAGVRGALGYAPEPSKKIYDLPVVTRFWEDPNPRHTKYADQLYEMMDEANAISATVNRFTRERRFDEAVEMRMANKDKLAVRVRLNRIGTQVRNVNNQIRLIQLDEAMAPDAKRARIDTLVDRKNRITREVARYADVF